MEINVALVVNANGLFDEYTVVPRLSVLGQKNILPTPEQYIWTADGDAQTSCRFSYELPTDLIPHRHFIKVLVACEQDLAFAAHALFVI